MSMDAHEITKILVAKKTEFLTLAAAIKGKAEALDVAIRVLEDEAVGNMVEVASLLQAVETDDAMSPKATSQNQEAEASRKKFGAR